MWRPRGSSTAPQYVRPDEVDALTEVYIRGFIEVPYDSAEWGPLPDDDHDDRTPDRAWPGRTAAVTALLPISGGALDDIPPSYEPTPEDWAEYRRTSTPRTGPSSRPRPRCGPGIEPTGWDEFNALAPDV